MHRPYLSSRDLQLKALYGDIPSALSACYQPDLGLLGLEQAPREEGEEA
jgi:hypothetical protein